jgi:ABC-type transport system substrate-binding protein
VAASRKAAHVTVLAESFMGVWWRFAEIATEFVRLKVDVIITLGGAVLAAKQATSVIPIVFVFGPGEPSTLLWGRNTPPGHAWARTQIGEISSSPTLGRMTNLLSIGFIRTSSHTALAYGGTEPPWPAEVARFCRNYVMRSRRWNAGAEPQRSVPTVSCVPSNISHSGDNALYVLGSVTGDHGKRAQLLQQAEQILLKDMPILPLYFRASGNLVSTRVKGWEDNLFNIVYVKNLSLEK